MDRKIREAIYDILNNSNIDPDTVVDMGLGEQTTFQLLEAAVVGTLDSISDKT